MACSKKNFNFYLYHLFSLYANEVPAPFGKSESALYVNEKAMLLVSYLQSYSNSLKHWLLNWRVKSTWPSAKMT